MILYNLLCFCWLLLACLTVAAPIIDRKKMPVATPPYLSIVWLLITFMITFPMWMEGMLPFWMLVITLPQIHMLTCLVEEINHDKDETKKKLCRIVAVIMGLTFLIFSASLLLYHGKVRSESPKTLSSTGLTV